LHFVLFYSILCVIMWDVGLCMHACKFSRYNPTAVRLV